MYIYIIEFNTYFSDSTPQLCLISFQQLGGWVETPWVSFTDSAVQVVTWGWEDAYSSDSSEVQEQLVGVREIQSTFDAFAAILQDGSVVTWGDPCHGGDSTDVQGQLRMLRRFRLRLRPLQPFWQMDLSFLGEVQRMVETALQWTSNWKMCRRFKLQKVFLKREHLLRFYEMVQL